jgi:general secretion pathway protein C
MSANWFEPKQKQSFAAKIRSQMQRLRASRSSRGSKNILSSPAVSRLKVRFLNFFLAFGQWFQLTVQPYLRRFNWRMIQILIATLVGTFFLANSISTFAASTIFSLVSSQKGNKSSKSSKSAGSENLAAILRVPPLGNPPIANTSVIRKEILGRNLFNSAGELAVEETQAISVSRKDLSIDFENVQCSSSEIPVKISGTIYTGDPYKSFVILKDPKIADSDIYKPGDAIIDHEQFEIYKVGRGVLELRNGNNKVCVAISGYSKNGDLARVQDGAGSGAQPGESKEFEFDVAFITQEIGDGYATILNCAKMIPDIDASGKMQGFKLISIATSCLFDRIEIKNGDIVTEVNGVSLKDPAQGFRLYQSLQEERTTTINIMRNGEPITRIVRVK